MKIAVYHNLPSGGAKRALFEMVRCLVDRHEIDVFTLSSANHDFCDLRSFVQKHQVFTLEPLPLLPSPLGLLNHGVRTADIFRLCPVEQSIAKEINHSNYDVVLVHTDQYTQSPLVLQFLQVPSVYYCQDALREVYDPSIARPYLQLTGLRDWVNRLNVLRLLYFATVTRKDKASLRAATLVLVNSYFSCETIYRLYAVRPQVCYLGIDTETFRPLGLERDDYVISVGAVRPSKGFDFIIESLALVPEQQRPLLLIVGNHVSSDEQRYLEAVAHRHNVRVEFRSLVQDTELVELYNRARITLYAPVLEPFGFVPLESMACDTPVIGVAEGGVRETISHGETGLLTDRDPKPFADAISELLTKPRLAEELGQRGPNYVQKHWNWNDSVARLESHLTAAAGKSSR